MRRSRIEFYQRTIKYIFILFMVFILIYLFIFDDYSFLNKYKAKRRIELINRKIDIIKKENIRLENENKKLKNDPETWERKARELGMKRKNEKIYKFKND